MNYSRSIHSLYNVELGLLEGGDIIAWATLSCSPLSSTRESSDMQPRAYLWLQTLETWSD
jgi:hypothetical protein